MPNGYDFSDDEGVLEEQREAAKAAEEWSSLDEKTMVAELNGLSSRVSACAYNLTWMFSENDYVKVRDMLNALRFKDLGAEGWLFSFYETNKDAFLHYLSGNAHPEWYNALKPDMQKTYDVGRQYYRDVKCLLNVSTAAYMVIQSLQLGEGFRLVRVKENFASAGFDEGLYQRIDTDIKRVYDFLNQDWDIMERNAHSSKSFLENNLSRLPKGELEQRYRAERLHDFQGLVWSSALHDSFKELPDGHFSVAPDILAKASVIDKYTALVSQTDNLKGPMQETLDECKKAVAQDVADAEQGCFTKAGKALIDAFRDLIEAISTFAQETLDCYTNFKDTKATAPYCYMKRLSVMSYAKPKYDFNPDTSDPWDHGTNYADLYTEAAKALGAQARLFVYDHGATIF